jgi:hypothetical protein
VAQRLLKGQAMSLPRLVALSLALVTTAPAAGCYYTFGTAPPRAAAPGVRPDCTRSRALPIVDTVIAVDGALGLGLGVVALATSNDDGSLPAGEAKATATMLAITGGALLLIHGLSARAGFRDRAQCRALDAVARGVAP